MLFDLHNDFPTVLEKTEYAEYLDRYEQTTVTSVIWTSKMRRASALSQVNAITDALCGIPSAPPVAIEDMGFLSPDDVEKFEFSRYFYCSLTWNHNNVFAGGALDDGTLTALGQRAIELMNGMCAVDLAHLNKRSFYAALEYAKKPMCSHTGFNSHPRSLDGDMIAALIQKGGVIGLCAVTAFTDAQDAKELAQTVDWFVGKYGVDSLCIGTDFNGSQDLPSDFIDYDHTDTLIEELYQLGYCTADIQKILYKNARRFYEEIKNERHI